MSKTLDTLPDDIHNLLNGADLSSGIDRFKDDIGSLMLSRFKEDTGGRDTLRMSSIGRPLRQQWYDVKGIQGEKLSGQTRFKFLYGDLVESLSLFLAAEAGHSVERLQEEVSVDGVLGHIDAVIDGVLIDVKSCSSFSFDKFKYGKIFEDDVFGYVGQLAGYAHALGLPAAWIAIDKVSGDICVCHLPQEKIDSYDVRDRIAKVRAAVSLDVPPERCYSDVPDGKSGNRKLPTGCSYCRHRFGCWSDCNDGKGLQVYNYSTGPRYLTTLVREPRVESYTPFETKE